MTPVAVVVESERSMNLISSGSDRVWICEIDPDGLIVYICIGAASFAGDISVRYPDGSANIPWISTIPLSVLVRMVMISGLVKNEGVENPPVGSELVAVGVSNVGHSPGLTRKK